MAEQLLAPVLARLSRAERGRLEQQLGTASKALWQARRALDEPYASQTSLTAWRETLHAVLEAATAAENIVTRQGPRSSA